MTLRVFSDHAFVGKLDMREGESFYGFTYDQAYLSFPNALPLSLSLPLNESRFSGEEALPYFEGLLPEGDYRAFIARKLGISRKSPAKLLRALGQDCAGDITIVEDDESPLVDQHAYEIFPESISNIALEPVETITRIQAETRLSLAGGQGKIALYHKESKSLDKEWYIPLSGSPSTHILKPSTLDERYPHLALNEFICGNAASACGIETATTDILYPENPLLVVRRYDRVWGEEQNDGLRAITRIHQEDCCQALGIPSILKYQIDGGPGFVPIYNLIKKYSERPSRDLLAFLKLGIFNYLIGNCDAHAKNYSLLHNGNRTVSLAPAYDLICTTIYDGKYGSKLRRGLGMSIGIHNNIEKVKPEDFRELAADLNLRLSAIQTLCKELIEGVRPAFEKAARKANNQGFLKAEELSERIVWDMEKRMKILEQV